MASAADELGNLLRGGDQSQAAAVQAAAAAAAAAAGGAQVDISKLSQLSDFADQELQKGGAPAKPGDAAAAAAAPSGAHAQPGFAHLALDPSGGAAPQLAYGAGGELPAGVLPADAAAAAAAMSQQAGGVPTDPQAAMAAAMAAAGAIDPSGQMAMALMPGMLGFDWSHMAVPHGGEGVDGGDAPGPRSRSGKPTRRGPMDEMRQLVRILVKLIPQSIAYIGANEEAGGGNRISEEQIKGYLDKTLGEAPRPQWGVPNGWNSYVAELFTWALGRPVDEESCRRCAKREPGRSWEALESELAAIGVHPHCWPLPLQLAAVREAEKNPIAQPVPNLPGPKREGESGRRPRQSAGPALDLNRLDELELWRHCQDVLNACTVKAGTAPPELQQSLSQLKGSCKAQMELLTTAGAMAGLNMLQYVPVMGLDGNASLMAFMGGVQGMPMGLPPVGGQMLGPDGQLLPADGAMVAAAAAAAEQAGLAGGEAGLPGVGGSEERAAKRPRTEGDGGEGEGGEEGKEKVPLSASDARGSLLGALGGADAGKISDKDMLAAQQLAAQQALMFAGQGLPQLAGLAAGFPLPGAGAPPAEGGEAAAEGQA